jgi:hypothetical protein
MRPPSCLHLMRPNVPGAGRWSYILRCGPASRMKTKRGNNGQAVVSTKDVVRFTEKAEETVKANARTEGRKERGR